MRHSLDVCATVKYAAISLIAPPPLHLIIARARDYRYYEQKKRHFRREDAVNTGMVILIGYRRQMTITAF